MKNSRTEVSRDDGGRLSADKGVKHIIRFVLVHHDVRFLIVAEPPSYDDLRFPKRVNVGYAPWTNTKAIV